jgi:5-methylcytosine-specific restriction endonuclease McrA
LPRDRKWGIITKPIKVLHEEPDPMPTRKPSGKMLVLEHLKQHVGEWIHNQEFRQISGLNDVPRVIRALRQEGWQIEVRGDGYVRLSSLEKGEPRGERKTISRKLRFQILQRDGFRCRACGRGPNNGVKLVIDHIIPIDWGGLTEESNLQTLCEECNSGKQAWVSGKPPEIMQQILSRSTVEARIEALFEAFPDQDVPSTLIQLVSKGALDWQRALRRIRKGRARKSILLKGGELTDMLRTEGVV